MEFETEVSLLREDVIIDDVEVIVVYEADGHDIDISGVYDENNNDVSMYVIKISQLEEEVYEYHMEQYLPSLADWRSDERYDKLI